MKNSARSFYKKCLISMAMSLFPATAAIATAPALTQAIGGFNLTESGGAFVYDAASGDGPLTAAQERVLAAKRLGASHIILNVRARMTGPYSNEVLPDTPPAARAEEARRMGRLMRFIKAQGMTVGIRPIFFVVGPNGEFPYEQILPDGSRKAWWHGNIQPSDPDRWFESFRVYLDQYILIAKIGKADEFTIGAELYSMTVGIEDQWLAYPYGFPGRWLDLLRYVRRALPDARLMYDVNFTDDTVTGGGLRKAGGEIERWRYRLADLAGSSDPAQAKIWQDLAAFWNELDAVGIDMYRSLASKDDVASPDFGGLTAQLKSRADSYAGQLDTILTEISVYVETDKPIIFKEVGFRSVDKGYIDPFSYAGSGVYNEVHQAAAYAALFQAFWAPNWPWFKGICFWDLPIDGSKSGPGDLGFSPLEKPLTEAQLRRYFAPNAPATLSAPSR